MIKNYYYLIVGILCLLFAYTHASNGESSLLLDLREYALAMDTMTVIHYVWHIITIENLVFGVGLIMMSFYLRQEKVQWVAWLIAALMVARGVVIFLFTMIDNREALSRIIVDGIAIVLVVILLILGSRVRHQPVSSP